MTITLNLSPAAEKEIAESIAHRDRERLEQLLTEAIPSTVAQLMNNSGRRLTLEEFRKLSHKLIEDFSASYGTKSPLLSDYAVSREGIYEEHP